MNKSFEFDGDTGELSNNDRPIDINFRKVDGDKVRKQMVRKLIYNRRENRENSRAESGSQSSMSNEGAMEV
jgi:adenylylsulfate kinase-like enzyme